MRPVLQDVGLMVRMSIFRGHSGILHMHIDICPYLPRPTSSGIDGKLVFFIELHQDHPNLFNELEALAKAKARKLGLPNIMNLDY